MRNSDKSLSAQRAERDPSAGAIARADARNPTRNATASERAAMLARGIRTDSGSVASAMLTALLRWRLGFFGRVGFLDPFQLRGNYPRMELPESEPRT